VLTRDKIDVSLGLLDGLFSPFGIECVLDGVGGLNEVVDVDA